MGKQKGGGMKSGGVGEEPELSVRRTAASFEWAFTIMALKSFTTWENFTHRIGHSF